MLFQFHVIFYLSKKCRYLDMVNERVIELKSIAQFVDAQAKIKEGCNCYTFSSSI